MIPIPPLDDVNISVATTFTNNSPCSYNVCLIFKGISPVRLKKIQEFLIEEKLLWDKDGEKQ